MSTKITSFYIFEQLFIPVIGRKEAKLLRQMVFWYLTMGRAFYKFIAPNGHDAYEEGDSWVEELGFSESTVRRLLRKLGGKIKKGSKLADVMANNPWFTYYTTWNNLTFFIPNMPLIMKVYRKLLRDREKAEAQKQANQRENHFDRSINHNLISLRERCEDEGSQDKNGGQPTNFQAEILPRPLPRPILKPKFNNLAEIQAKLEPQYGVYWLPAARSLGLIREEQESDPVAIEEKLAWIKKLPAKITMTTIAHLNDLETWEVELIALRLLHRLNSGKNAIIRNVSAYLNHSLARAIKFDPTCNPGELERLRKSFGY